MGVEVEINEGDIKQKLKTSKNKKAPGLRNIFIKLLKYGMEKLRRMLQNMFQQALNGNTHQ